MTQKNKKKISFNYKQKKKNNSKYVNVIKEDLETPKAEILHCSIYKPNYFSGSPIPRYKVIIDLDPENNKEHKKYLEMLEKLAIENEVEKLGKLSDTNTVIMSYQGKERPDTFLVENGSEKRYPIDLEHDVPEGIECKIKFDLKTYFDKQSQKNAFSFSPKEVTFYLNEDNQKMLKVEDGDCENSGD